MSERSKQKAIEYLQRDPISYVVMLEALRRGRAEILYAEESGVVIYEHSGCTCMISVQCTEQYKAAVDFKKYCSFAVHQEEIADWIQSRGSFPHRLETLQAVYNKRDPLPGDFDAIRPLSCDYTDQIFESYDVAYEKEYIEALVAQQKFWGIFENDALVGFIGEHAEGSIGFLTVFPAYRRKGYAYTLEAFLINRFLQAGRTPFGQVIRGNATSFALQRKLGMEISTLPTFWIFE